VKRKYCSLCGLSKDADEFGVMPNLPAGRSNRCKRCIAESSKASQRMYRWLPLFEKLIKSWDDAQIDSEMEYLRTKLRLLRAEMKERH
jgi:hypothetical protein